MGIRSVLCFILAALATLLAGCEVVLTPHPLPQASLRAEEQARLAGTWVAQLSGGAPYSLMFDCKGVAHLALLDWDKDHYTLKQGVVVFTRSRRWGANSGFLSLSAMSKTHSHDYLFVRYKFVSPENLVIWGPARAPFDAAIKAGRLKGSANQDGPLEITAAPAAALHFLDDSANPPLFVYDKPLLFRKVSGPAGQLTACGK